MFPHTVRPICFCESSLSGRPFRPIQCTLAIYCKLCYNSGIAGVRRHLAVKARFCGFKPHFVIVGRRTGNSNSGNLSFKDLKRLRALFIGDVVGAAGCDMLLRHLPSLKKEYGADLVVVNGENSAEGNGILPKSADSIFAAGADVITGGNHSFRRKEIVDYMESHPFLIRPANYPPGTPGEGMCIVDKGFFTAAVINLLGVVYLQPNDCPFRTADAMIKRAHDAGAQFIFIDMHAEATSEKKSLAMYLDKGVTAVVGAPYACKNGRRDGTFGRYGVYKRSRHDRARIRCSGSSLSLPSILFLKKLPVRFKNASGECILNGCIIEADKKSGLASSIESFEICG